MTHAPQFFVYILHSQSHHDRFYTGFTTDLADRLQHHNAGAVPSTKPYRPWRFKTYVAFSDEDQARAFERYLKTQSGRASRRSGCDSVSSATSVRPRPQSMVSSCVFQAS